MNEIPKLVFSDSLVSADWGETTIATVRFARSLVETGLLDEYRLVIHPVVLGAGERLFMAPLTVESMSTTVFQRRRRRSFDAILRGANDRLRAVDWATFGPPSRKSPVHHLLSQTAKKAPLCRQKESGETRTRTGDTTIFRQALRTLDQARKRLQIALFLVLIRARRCRAIRAWT